MERGQLGLRLYSSLSDMLGVTLKILTPPPFSRSHLKTQGPPKDLTIGDPTKTQGLYDPLKSALESSRTEHKSS